MKEATLENDILQYLRYMGIMCWRSHDAKHRPCEMGVPDILGCFSTGRMIAVEVKRPGKKPTLIQTGFLSRLQHCGALAFVATSIRDVQEALR
jgi:hypothetical protein